MRSASTASARTTSPADLAGAHGIGLRKELTRELLADPEGVDFLEVVAEACFSSARTRREVVALSERWPIVPHGIKLSLGSAEGIDLDHARRLAALARDLRAPYVSEHVAFTRASGREIGHLTPLPRTASAVEVVARNVGRARAALPDTPLLLENVAAPFGYAEDSIPEPELYALVCEASGCDLLLDVSNLYANAVNAGRDPLEVARAYPLERARMIHLAGGVFEDGFYFDTHAHDVPEAIFEVLAAVLARAPEAAVLIERDGHFGAGLAPRLAELARANACRGGRASARQGAGAPTAHAAGTRSTSTRGAAHPEQEGAAARLEVLQAEVARALTDTPRQPGAAAGVDAAGVARARTILERKRVEEALAHLPRLSRHVDEARPLAHASVGARARTSRLASIADAVAIAERARSERTLADDAERDLLVLRARFDATGADPAPRRGPFVGRAVLSNGTSTWATKGLGEEATVRVWGRAPAVTKAPV